MSQWRQLETTTRLNFISSSHIYVMSGLWVNRSGLWANRSGDLGLKHCMIFHFWVIDSPKIFKVIVVHHPIFKVIVLLGTSQLCIILMIHASISRYLKHWCNPLSVALVVFTFGKAKWTLAVCCVLPFLSTLLMCHKYLFNGLSGYCLI